MQEKFRGSRARWVFIALVISLCFGNLMVAASIQDDDEGTRNLFDSQFLKKRPAAKPTTTNQTAKNPPKKKYSYKRVTPANSTGGNQLASLSPSESTLIGITLWRLRPAGANDEQGTRLLVQEEKSADGTELVPERVEAGKPLSAGQRVRLTIEVPREGYLYVIDREKYSDGTFSEPYLIFPTLRTRGGKNDVSAGRTIEIPAQDDNPSYFKLMALDDKSKYAGEVLTVLVSPQPIAGLSVGAGPIKLKQEQFDEWEKKWGTKTEQLTLEGGEGQTYTTQEKAAGKDSSRLLTQDDPLPQTLYRVANRPGETLLITVPLEIKK